MKGEGGEKEEVGHGVCVCFSESVLSTILIINKCLVLKQQVPLSSVISVVGDLHIMFAIWNKKGRAVPQKSTCC